MELRGILKIIKQNIRTLYIISRAHYDRWRFKTIPMLMDQLWFNYWIREPFSDTIVDGWGNVYCAWFHWRTKSNWKTLMFLSFIVVLPETGNEDIVPEFVA